MLIGGERSQRGSGYFCGNQHGRFGHLSPAVAIKASEGKRAEIKVENGTLVLRPIVKPARKLRYTLDELLSGMTRDNVSQEVDWGPRRGNEAW